MDKILKCFLIAFKTMSSYHMKGKWMTPKHKGQEEEMGLHCYTLHYTQSVIRSYVSEDSIIIIQKYFGKIILGSS